MGEVGFKVYWPFHNRDAYLYVTGTPDPESDAVLILIRSIDGNKWLDKEIEKDPDFAECLVHYCAIHFKRVSPEKQIMTILSNFDPQMTYVP